MPPKELSLQSAARRSPRNQADSQPPLLGTQHAGNVTDIPEPSNQHNVPRSGEDNNVLSVHTAQGQGNHPRAEEVEEAE
jgi:hypothetical protein